MASSKSRLKVGSADDADIVIKQATVSRYHCEFRLVGGTWELHDLDSTNGTFVDGKRITSPVRISSATLITLGRGVPLAIPAVPNDGLATVLETRENAPSYSSPTLMMRGSNQALVYMVATAAAMMMLGGIGFLIFQLGRQGASRADVVTAASAGATPQDPNGSVSKQRSDVDQAATTSNSNQPMPKGFHSEVKNEITSPKSIQSQLERDPAFWGVVVESADGKERRLIGTAVAVEPKRLVMLASIADAHEVLKTSYPKLILMRADAGKELIASEVVTHPKHKSALAALEDFNRRLEEKSKSYGLEQEIPDEDSFKWSKQYQLVMAEIVNTDLAAITTSESLDRYYPIGKGDIGKQPAPCFLRGFPMTEPPLDVRQQLSDYYVDLPATYSREAGVTEMSLQAETTEPWDLPVVSMVCMNANSQVIGLCELEEPGNERSATKRTLLSRVEAFWE